MRKITKIVLHHSASKAANHTWEEIRQWHLAKGWSDIGYHYGVVFDGGKYQIKLGRPEDQIGAHAKGYNSNSIGICFEGNFSEGTVPEELRKLGTDLVIKLCKKYNLTEKNIFGHRELPYPTECPGKNFPLNSVRFDVKVALDKDKNGGK